MRLKLLFFGFTFVFLSSKAQNIDLYVGTYTKRDSKGIYKLNFNTETGVLNNKKLVIHADDPSFLTYAPDRKFMYSVNGSGFVSSYKINEDKSLSLLTRMSSNGKGPCHIAINKEGSKIVVSNYGAGTVSIYPIKENGYLGEASQVFNHNKGEKPARAHSAQFHENDLYVADLGNNAVYHYELDGDKYKLKSDSIVKMEGNPGPRHFVLTKDDQYIYIINEYGGSITSVKKTKKRFEQIDFDSTLDDDYKGQISCADIHLSKDERFLYGSNRGENSIAVFKRNTEDGTIERIQNMSVYGDWPRNFTLDPTGKFLLVANRKSDNISVFKINTETGKLSFLYSIDMPSPVCLLF
ncbi:lactonase family protein [uncultured Algibacter sp.]|uniref:lactonase family protein n=1 Tax=uncultured Algibacter sp. TaxID=298659 RepID=UPI0026181269|nr:lactonase family protein [uncultured Algibacter sp.]